MLIALQLVGTPQGPARDEPVRRFEDEQVTIGRAPNCQLVLPDGLRIISRHHARLTMQRGEVLLTCLSASAPVRVNESSVQHGGTLPVGDGDVIHIGGFDLRLSTETAAPAAALAPPPPASAPASAPAPAPEPAPASAAVPAPVRHGRARLDEWFDLEPAAAPVEPAVRGSTARAPAEAVDLDLRSGAYSAGAQGAELRVFESLQQVLEGRAEPAAEPLPPEPPTPAAPAPADAAPELAALHDEERHALMLAFLEGAGLAHRTGITSAQLLAPMELSPAWMRNIGELLRASVEGALALLHSRSTVKREMRAEVTVIARRRNNPLKFAPDALAALAHLVAAKRSPGFLEPVAALKDAHEDLLVHHLAVVAGMRAAMFELISRLGPDDIVREAGPAKGLSTTLPALHDAALWRRYRQRHAEMTARLDDDFETVFGREFTKAYEAQARRVREQAPPDDTHS